MSGPIVIHSNAFVSRWFVKPEQREAFVERFNALWQADVEGLKQAVHFAYYGWGRNEDEFVAIECWKDESMVAVLRASEGFKTAVSGLMSCCTKSMEMDLFSPWEGGRDVFAEYPSGPSKVHPTSGAIGATFL